MKFAKLEQLANALTPEEASAQLRSLAADPRFAAVVWLVKDQKELASDSSARLDFANNHGCLAHAAGVRYGMLELEGKIKQITDPPKNRGAQSPPAKQ